MTPLRVPPGRLLTHQLPRQAFEQLRHGPVTEDFLAVVDAAQYSRRKLLLRALADFCVAHPRTLGPLTDMETLWKILATAEERDPLIARDVVTYPPVGVWASRMVRKVHGDEPDPVPVWSELGYLHWLVAAAVIRAEVPCVIRLPIVHGAVTLPTVGHVRVPTSFPAGFADLHNTSASTTLRTPYGMLLADLKNVWRGGHFLAARRHVTAARGLRLEVEINDADPYREFSEPIPPQRLDPVRFTQWVKMLDEAFDILTRWHPEYAREIAAGLRMVTPLAHDGVVRGASSSVAFGCVAASEKSSATALAETLVHEFQHSKLNGLLSLFEVGTQENMYAPWRDDPRPLSGLLHGIFAFLSVAEFWHVQCDLVPEQEMAAAHFTFALRRHQVDEATRSLRHHLALTRIGHELVEGVHARLEVIRRPQVSPELMATVLGITDDHRACWRVRHAKPHQHSVVQLASAWLAGAPAAKAEPPHIIPNPRTAGRSVRRDLLELKATDPETLTAVMRQSTASPADAAFVSGDYIGATNAYLTRLHSAPDDTDSWIGLGLSMRARGFTAAAGILDAPETLIAVHNRILALTGSAPDPLLLADWFRDALPGAE